jgi:hypothetical protein
MAPITTMSILAFATAALAVPHGHGGHAKYHNNRPSGFSQYPYPSANGTGIYPTGTGLATGSAPIAPASETAVVSDVEFTTEVATTYADATTTCTSDITVTSTVKKTVTVTASASSDAAPVESSSSSEASPVLSSSESSAPAYSAASTSEVSAVQSSSESSAPAYSAAPTSYSSKAEAVTQAAYSSPAPSSSASSVEESSSDVASPTMTYSAANKNVDVNVGYSSSSAAPSSTSASSYGSGSSSGKRGLAFNDAKLTDCLTSSSKISWGYNWGSSPSGLSDSIKFIPTLWGTASMYTDSWSDNAKKAIGSGSTHLFSFNEPDLAAQSNMSPQDAATAYKKYMEPFAGQAKLCAPSVTNGAGSMGLGWLKSFLESCSDCTIDCINIHWYDSAENVSTPQMPYRFYRDSY